MVNAREAVVRHRTSAPRNLRAEWANNSSLHDAVQDDLVNWAAWCRDGSLMDLGYLHEEPFSVSGEDLPDHDVDRALETEGYLVLWRQMAREARPDVRRYLVSLLLALKLHYRTDKAAHTKAKILGVGRRTFYKLLDEAKFRYWVIARA